MILQRVGIPIYLQVKNYILDKIRTGEYRPGTKIPTERELASELGISRNTVSSAYKELLLEGVLEAKQGRGTFVKAASDQLGAGEEVSGSRRERLVKIIDDAMNKVVELGFSLEHFSMIANIRAKEKMMAVKELRVAVVDCAEEFIQRFIRQIDQTANVCFEPVILRELEAGLVSVELLKACDMVVTTLDHQATVAALMGTTNKLVAVATVPNLDAVIKLARLPANTEVAVVARSAAFTTKLRLLLEKTSFNNDLTFVAHQTDDKQELASLLRRYKVVVVSEEREMLVRQLGDEEQDVITFYYEIDRGSLNQVMMQLVAQTL